MVLNFVQSILKVNDKDTRMISYDFALLSLSDTLNTYRRTFNVMIRSAFRTLKHL